MLFVPLAIEFNERRLVRENAHCVLYYLFHSDKQAVERRAVTLLPYCVPTSAVPLAAALETWTGFTFWRRRR